MLKHDNIKSWDYPLNKTANRFDQGACVTPVLFGWNATLQFIEHLGTRKIEQRVRELGGYCIEQLQELPHINILTPTTPTKRHGLIMYSTDSWEKDTKIFNRLHVNPPLGEKPIKVSLRSLGGIEGIRICTHFFNTKEDIDQLINAQKSLLKD